MLGESAGRSQRNPVDPTARRRFSVEERNKKTHSPDDPAQWPEVIDLNAARYLRERGAMTMMVIGLTFFVIFAGAAYQLIVEFSLVSLLIVGFSVAGMVYASFVANDIEGR